MKITMKDEQRINVVEAVERREISKEDGGRLLRVTVRQVNRLLGRLKEAGIRGLIHGNRERRSPRKTGESVRQEVVRLAQTRYRDVNDTHFTELLAREEKIFLSRSTVRRILRGEGMAPKQKRRSPRYRSRRERREAFGMMLQIDASPHDWLEGRGPWLSLVGAIDDATGHVWTHFEEAETTWAYFHLMEEVFVSQGLPLSLYSDRHTIFFSPREPTIVEQFKNTGPLTQFGRAMKELGIRIIPAYSPQAKGRVERLWRTFQDRLVVELRLAGVITRQSAQEVLERFLDDFNRRFTVPARQRDPVFRTAPSPSRLDRILCLKEERVVNHDHTISFEGLILQIPPSRKFRSIARQKVEVLQLKNGGIEITHSNKPVARFSPEAVTRMIETYKIGKSELKKKAA